MPIVTGAFGTITKEYNRTEGLGNKRTSGDNPN